MNSDFLTSIAAINVRKRNGWNEIHSEISNYNLYLKYTKNKFFKHEKYGHAIRVVNITFRYRKPYVWLKNVENTNIYHYEMKPPLTHNDVYSFDENGKALDDDIDYSKLS